MPLVDAYATAGRTMAKNMLFDDTIEGISAFIDKRKPDWN
jgi:1,4-dihydroxy-2-naphthoyl-CoA synthase